MNLSEDQLEKAAEALKAEFRTLNAEWFVEDCKNDGSCDMTPWNLLVMAVVKTL